MSTDTLNMTEIRKQADQVVKNNIAWAAGGGLIVVPFVDIAAVTAVEIKMIKELAELYEVPFRKKAARSIIASIVGGSSANLLAYSKVGAIATGSLLKVVPVVGTIFGAATMSVFASAITYAIGSYFIKHFEEGGSLDDVDVSEASAEVEATTKEKMAKETSKKK